MDIFPHPPWTATADETRVPDSTAFNDCDRVMSAFAAKANATVTERRYSLSKPWGRVLRAKVEFAAQGLAGAVLVTCWSSAGQGVQFAAEVHGCGPQQAGC